MFRDKGRPSWYILLVLLPFHSFAAGTPGTLALFLTQQCNRASFINPTVNLPVNTCLVTHGADGIASFVMYEDTSCARKGNMDLQYENCYFDGPNGLTAVGFECPEDGGGGGTTSTSTVSAGSSSLAVAVGTPEAVAPVGATPQTNGASTTYVPNASSTASNPSQPTTDSSGSSDGGDSSGPGLSQKWQIVLGVVVPVMAIVVALLAWWFPCHKGRM